MKNEVLLVSGIPRSGTSLITSILSKIPHSINFSEPRFIKDIKIATKNADDVTNQLELAVKKIRLNIKAGKPVEFRVHKNPNKNLDNYFNRHINSGKTVVDINSSHQEITLDRTRYSDLIVIKNNLLFTACIQSLLTRFKMLFVIRDPVATLCSWNSLNLPVSRGEIKSGLKYNRTLQEMIKSDELLERQIQIFDWYCYQYRQVEKQTDVIKYEELIQHPNKILSNYLNEEIKITGLKNMNNSPYYSKNHKDEIIDIISHLKPLNILHYYPI